MAGSTAEPVLRAGLRALLPDGVDFPGLVLSSGASVDGAANEPEDGPEEA